MPRGLASGVWARGQMHANESGQRVWEQPESSSPPTPTPPPSTASWATSARRLTAQCRAIVLWRLREQLQAHVVPCLAEPGHVAGLDGRPQQGPAPSAACQGARCCHWKKLLHNLKSWSFDHSSERMKRRGSKWWFENASVSLHPSVPIRLSLVRDSPLDVFISATKPFPPSSSKPWGWKGGLRGKGVSSCLLLP